MLLYIYDKALNQKGIYEDVISFIWARRYWKCGDFKLLTRLTPNALQLFAAGNIIVPHGQDEAGVVEYIGISKDEQGFEQLEVVGRFTSAYMGLRVIAGQYQAEQRTTSDIAADIITQNITNPNDKNRTIKNIFLLDMVTEDGKVDYISEPYENVLAAVENLCMNAKIGFKTVLSPILKRHVIQLYKGVERTAGTEYNCIFSKEYDNLIGADYTFSNSNYATCGWCLGAEIKPESEDEQPITPVEFVEKEHRSGLDRIEVLLDGNDIKADEVPDITAALEARGLSLLAGMEVTESFDGEINTRVSPLYKRDFDVGDRITVRDTALNITRDLRITETTETYENGKNSLSLTFGESLPTKIKITGAYKNGGKIKLF